MYSGTARLLLLFVISAAAHAEVIVLPNSSPQSALVRDVLPNPVRLQVLDAGVPVAGAQVFFRTPHVSLFYGGVGSSDGSECVGGDLEKLCLRTTGADGVAQFVTLTSWYAGEYTLNVSATDSSGTRDLGSSTLSFRFEPRPVASELTDMWWGGPEQNGWGMSIVRHGNQLFNVLFVYDDAGLPTWLVQPGGHWFGTGYVFDGPVYSPRGTPWFSYDATQLVAGVPVGQLSLTFEDSKASMLLRRSLTSPIQRVLVRQDFTGEAPSPIHGLADMWWGGAQQNGWGIAILEQPGNLFLVWFTYDAGGKPVWFAMPGGTWTASDSYSGTIYRTRANSWFGGAYDATTMQPEAVGAYTVRFVDSGRATFDYSLEGRAGTLPLQRQPFD